MKAIQIKETGSFDVLKYVEVETPTPGPTQVLVKTDSISVNYADTMLRRGIYPMMPPFPAIPGLECSGVIESIGEEVEGIELGQPVIVFGPNCYAEYVIAEAAKVVPIAEGIDLAHAAALTVNYLTAYHMLHTMADVKKEQTVMVYAAAGGVGTAVIQLSKVGGFSVIGLTSGDEKVEYAKKQGVDHIINYRREDVLQRVRDITHAKGVDLILNSVAGDTFARDFEALAPLGQIIWFGFAAGPPEENLVNLLQNHFGKSIGIRAFVIYTIADVLPERFSQSYETLFRYLKEGSIKPHIQDRIPLAEASRAHQMLESGTVRGKLILKP